MYSVKSNQLKKVSTSIQIFTDKLDTRRRRKLNQRLISASKSRAIQERTFTQHTCQDMCPDFNNRTCSSKIKPSSNEENCSEHVRHPLFRRSLHTRPAVNVTTMSTLRRALLLEKIRVKTSEE